MEREWIWLATLTGIGPVWQKRLLNHFGGRPQRIYRATEDELRNVEGVSERLIKQILKARSFDLAEKILESSKKGGVSLLTFEDEEYPKHAKSCTESPVLLFYKGKLKKIESGVAVVGARRCTAYGRRVASELGTQLGSAQVPLISGFAKGIDSYAQAACLRAGGYTIAFLGSGVDICYPKEQRRLYDQLIEEGNVFISKYPPGTPVKPVQFVERNALISAWSTEVVIVEAGEKSGALWTAKFARKQGKRILAVPQSIYSKEGIGCNQLLETGVVPYLGAHSLEAIQGGGYREGHKTGGLQEPITIMSANNEPISLTGKLPCTITQLKTELGRQVNNLEDQLFDLELSGKIAIKGQRIHQTE